MAAEGDDSGAVRVAVRCRPLFGRELANGEQCSVNVDDDEGVVTVEFNEKVDRFAFDFAYGPKSEQSKVFEDLGLPLLNKAFGGYNGTIFAYGQTGSGKTHSMMGDPDCQGLIPRINSELFRRVASERASNPGKRFLVVCSYFEIYNEILYDLLAVTRDAGGLQIKESKALGIYVQNLQEVVVDSEAKITDLMTQGSKMRKLAATEMNAQSSRSHSIFTIKIHQKDEGDESRNVFARVNLVDLAGSERAAKTKASGDRLKEGANINKSLSALGNVINALAEKSKSKKRIFIPYRNSKLTRVLQDSLGGNSLCSMLATLSPALSNSSETLSTLKYANRAKSIEVNATKNEEMSSIARLNAEVEQLRKKLAERAGGGAGAAMDEDERLRIASRYEDQITEIESMMQQTWEDKAKMSAQHQSQLKQFEAEQAAEKARLTDQYRRERQRRHRLLAEKGDIALCLKEVEASGGTADKIPGWVKLVERIQALSGAARDQALMMSMYTATFAAASSSGHSVPAAP